VRHDVEVYPEGVGGLLLLVGFVVPAHVDEGRRGDTPEVDRDAESPAADTHRPKSPRIVELCVVQAIGLRKRECLPERAEVAPVHRLAPGGRWRSLGYHVRQVSTTAQDERGDSIWEVGGDGTGERRAPRVAPYRRPFDPRSIDDRDDVGGHCRPGIRPWVV